MSAGAGAEGEAIVPNRNQPAGNSYCKEEFPPETLILSFSFAIIVVKIQNLDASLCGHVCAADSGGLWTGACTRGKTDGSVIATLKQGR